MITPVIIHSIQTPLHVEARVRVYEDGAAVLETSLYPTEAELTAEALAAGRSTWTSEDLRAFVANTSPGAVLRGEGETLTATDPALAD